MSAPGTSVWWRHPLAHRIGQSVVVVWLAFTISFLLLYVLPGDAALARIGGDAGAADVSQAQIEALRAELGLDQPAVVRYGQQLLGVVTGDLGTSLRTDRPVVDILAEALPQTFTLAVGALVVAVLAGTFLAVAAAWTRSGWLRSLLLALPATGMGLPVFWVGLVLITLFSFTWRLLPSSGNEGFPALVLPAVTLAIVPAATIAQVLATSLDEALAQAYATTAAGKGASRSRVVVAHCLRNAAMPALTVAGVVVGNLVAGSVVIETVFSRSGTGRVLLDAVQTVDLTVVQAVVLVGAVVFVTVNLLVDLAYPLLDPRVRTSLTREVAR